MPYTTRFLFLLAGAPLLLALSYWLPAAGIAALVYTSILILLLFRDLAGLPRAVDIGITCTIDKDLSVATDNSMALQIRVRGKRTARAEIRETVPKEIQLTPETAICELLPNKPCELQFRVRPTRRGRYTIGPVYIRLTGVAGLAERKIRIEVTDEVNVIPDLLATRKYDLRLRRGLIKQAGMRTMRLAGRGGEFESLRTYSQDDDPRHIDWKSSARRGKMLTKQYQPESKQRIIISIDLGRLMLGKFGEVAKLDAVLNATLLLSHAALREGDSVGLIAFADELAGKLRTGAGSRQIKLLLRQISALEARPVESDYRLLLRELSTVERRRALVVIFTDFIDESQIDDMLLTLLALRRKHRILVAAVRDAEIFQLAHATASTSREAFGAAAASHLLLQRRAAIAKLESAGILVADLGQEELGFGVVERYLQLRESAAF